MAGIPFWQNPGLILALPILVAYYFTINLAGKVSGCFRNCRPDVPEYAVPSVMILEDAISLMHFMLIMIIFVKSI